MLLASRVSPAPALMRRAAAARAAAARRMRPASANAVVASTSSTVSSEEATSTTSTSSSSPSSAAPTSSSSSPTPSSSAATETPAPAPVVPWKLKLLHDSDCPLCEREVSMLKRRDAERTNSICFVDVADPSYNAEENCGIDYETAMRTIHGIVPDEKNDFIVMTGVDVFRKAYDLVGLGWVYSFLDVPILKKIASSLYDAWARIRLPLTGRPTLEVVLAEKKTCRDVGEGK